MSSFATGSYKRGRARSRSTSRSLSRGRMVSNSRSLSRQTRYRQTYKQPSYWPYQSIKSYKDSWDPFPARVCAIMRYYSDFSITPGTGTAGNHLFSANGIYDPDITGTGHQPYGFDTYASIYNHYRVKRSTITVTAVNHDSAVIFGVARTDDTTVSIDYNGCKEQKGATFILDHGSNPAQSVVSVFNADFYKDSNTMYAAFTANPTEQMYFDVFATMISASTTGATRYFQVSIVYEVEMWELKDLGTS